MKCDLRCSCSAHPPPPRHQGNTQPPPGTLGITSGLRNFMNFLLHVPSIACISPHSVYNKNCILCFRLTSTSSRMRSFWCCHQPSSRLRKNRRRCPRKVTSEFCRPEEISCLSCQAGNRRKARSYVSNIGLLLTLRRLVPFSHEGDL